MAQIGKIIKMYGKYGKKGAKGRLAKRIGEEAAFEAAFTGLGSMLSKEQKKQNDQIKNKPLVIPSRSSELIPYQSVLVSPKVEVKSYDLEINQLPPIDVKPIEVSQERIKSDDSNLEIRVARNEKRLNLFAMWVQDTNKKIEDLQKKVTENNGVLNSLNEVTKNSREDFRRQNLKNERKSDEQQLENKKSSQSIFQNINERYNDLVSSGRSLLSKLTMGVAGVGLASAFMLPDEDGSINIEEIGEIIDAVESGAIGGVVAAKTLARKGITKASMVSDIRQVSPNLVSKIEKINRSRRSVDQSKKASDLRATFELKPTNISGKSSLSGSEPNKINQIISKLSKNSPIAKKIISNLQQAKTTIIEIAKKADNMKNSAFDVIKKLPKRLQNLAKKGLKGIVKWTIVIEVINLMIRLTERYMLGTMEANEYHDGMKKQVNRILKLFGAPWVLSLIFGSLGTVLPVLGNITGAIAGLIVGILFADKIYDVVGMNVMVDALYDFTVHHDTKGFKQIGNNIVNFVTKQIPKIIAEKTKETFRGLLNMMNLESDTDEKKYNNRRSRRISKQENLSISIAPKEVEMAESISDIVSVSYRETGSGYTIQGATDAYGRPVVFAKQAAAAFKQMMEDSNGIVKPTDVVSSQRSQYKNKRVGGSKNSKHLLGLAMDIHGESKEWIKENGSKYGWKLHDYTGSHGGHFIFESSRASQFSSKSIDNSKTFKDLRTNSMSYKNENAFNIMPLSIRLPSERNQSFIDTNKTSPTFSTTPSYITRDFYIEKNQFT